MALTKISSSEIQTGAITTDKFSGDVALSVRIANVSIANSTYTVLDDTAVNVGGGYIVVTGAGFQSGAQVVINETPATSTTFVSSTELRAQIGAKSAATYDVYVINPDGGNAISVNGITYSTTPTWVTGSTLDPQDVDTAFNVSFSATGATSYANTTALPAGTTLLSNGYFYGTITGIGSETTYNFTISAIDNENQNSEREFSLTVSVGLYVTVTPVGQSSYQVDVLSSALQFDSTYTYYSLQTPSTFTGEVTMWGGGGNGGPGLFPGGTGGYSRANVTFQSGTTYNVVVGRAGSAGNAPSRIGGGGGGATALTINPAHSTILLVAGAGGGGGQFTPFNSGRTAGGGGGGSSGVSRLSTGGGGGSQSAAGAGGTFPGKAGGSAGSGRNGGTGAGGASASGGFGFGFGGAGGLNPGDCGGGGGGGGYFGGGGGASDSGSSGGGGGSGYYNPSYPLLTNGSTSTFADSGNPYRGTAGNAASAGKVVIVKTS